MDVTDEMKTPTAFTLPEEMIDGLALLGYRHKKSRSQLVVDAIEAAYGDEMRALIARFAESSAAPVHQSVRQSNRPRKLVQS